MCWQKKSMLSRSAASIAGGAESASVTRTSGVRPRNLSRALKVPLSSPSFWQGLHFLRFEGPNLDIVVGFGVILARAARDFSRILRF